MICLLKFEERQYLFTSEVAGDEICMWIWEIDTSDSDKRVMYHLKLKQVYQRNRLKEKNTFVGLTVVSEMRSSDIIEQQCYNLLQDPFVSIYSWLCEGVRETGGR